MGKVDEMVEEKVEAPERLWFRRMEVSGHPTWLQTSGHDSEDVEYVRADAPNTHQRAERAAAKIASEINGGDRDDFTRPPELIALLDDPSIDNEVRLGKWLADIIAAEFEK